MRSRHYPLPKGPTYTEEWRHKTECDFIYLMDEDRQKLWLDEVKRCRGAVAMNRIVDELARRKRLAEEKTI